MATPRPSDVRLFLVRRDLPHDEQVAMLRRQMARAVNERIAAPTPSVPTPPTPPTPSSPKT